MTTSPEASGLSGRVALLHDWVNGFRGGEKVLELIARETPDADLYTLFFVPGSSHPTIERRRVVASWMNRLPGVGRYYRYLLPLFPGWVDGLDLRAYDLVLSSSHCVVKGAVPRRDAVHVCYCHTPMRYVWDRFDDYFGRATGPKRSLLRWQAARLRAWDRATAERVDLYLANSRFVAGRIREFYGLAPDRVRVLHPPVDVERFAAAAGAERTDRYLVVSALVPYKRVETAIRACLRLGRPLTVAGSGPERERLEALVRAEGAGDRVRFLGFVPDPDLPDLMASHRALLFPGVEDFGITPVEATAAGLPVIALARGGALDTIAPGANGVLHEEEGVDGVVAGIREFEASTGFTRDAMLKLARGFAPERFRRDYLAHVSEARERGPVRRT